MDKNLTWFRRQRDEAWLRVKSPLYRNALIIMLSSVIGQGLGFFFWLIVARFYAPADVGYAVALYQTLWFLATLAGLGLGIGIIRHLPEIEEKNSLINTAATICGAISLILATIFLCTVGFIAPGLAFVLRSPIYIIAILATTTALALPTVFDQASYAMRRAEVTLWRVLIFSLAKIPLAGGFALISVTNGHLGVFLSLALACIASVIIEMFLLLPRILADFRPRIQLVMAHIRPILRFSLGNYSASSIGVAGSLLLPIVIISVTGPAGAENAAFYYVASLVAGLLNIIPIGVFTSFYAEASQKNANRLVDEKRAITLSVSLLVPGIVILWLFSEEMLKWFGDPAYAAGAVDALRILIFGSIPLLLNNILITRIRIRKRSAPLVAGSIISTAVILGLGIVLLQNNGITGLAAASVLGTAVAAPYYFAVARAPFE